MGKINNILYLIIFSHGRNELRNNKIGQKPC